MDWQHIRVAIGCVQSHVLTGTARCFPPAVDRASESLRHPQIAAAHWLSSSSSSFLWRSPAMAETLAVHMRSKAVTPPS